jgi:hypothetical protein
MTGDKKSGMRRQPRISTISLTSGIVLDEHGMEMGENNKDSDISNDVENDLDTVEMNSIYAQPLSGHI